MKLLYGVESYLTNLFYQKTFERFCQTIRSKKILYATSIKPINVELNVKQTLLYLFHYVFFLVARTF